MVPAFPLVLCGGSDIHIKLHQGSFVIEVDDGWIKFVCDSHKVKHLIHLLKLIDLKNEQQSIEAECVGIKRIFLKNWNKN